MIKFLFRYFSRGHFFRLVHRLLNKEHINVSDKDKNGVVDIRISEANFPTEWVPIFPHILEENSMGRFIKIGRNTDAIVVVAEIKQNATYQAHMHSDANEYVQVVSGKIYEAHTKTTMLPGDLLFTPAGKAHSLQALENSVYLLTHKFI